MGIRKGKAKGEESGRVVGRASNQIRSRTIVEQISLPTYACAVLCTCGGGVSLLAFLSFFLFLFFLFVMFIRAHRDTHTYIHAFTGVPSGCFSRCRASMYGVCVRRWIPLYRGRYVARYAGRDEGGDQPEGERRWTSLSTSLPAYLLM